MKLAKDYNMSSPITAPSPPELQAIADLIKERDQKFAKTAQEQWLDNGRDLTRARVILGHGEFGKWCEEKLKYSKRTAEKLMRAAKVFGPLVKNEPGSHLPCPNLVYLLSAKSVPKEIFETFAHLVLAGDDVRRDLQAALKKHREEAKREKAQKKLVESYPAALVKQYERERAKAKQETLDEAQRAAERERREKARSAAMELLQVRMGSDLAKWMELVAVAGAADLFEALDELAVNGAAAELGNIAVIADEPASAPFNESVVA